MSISNRWLTIFLVFPQLNIFYNSSQITTIMFAWQSSIIIVALFLLFKKTTIFNVILFIFISIILISSMINGNLGSGIAFTSVMFLSFCIYISYALREPNEFFNGLYILFSLVIVVNFLTILSNGITTDIYGRSFYLLGGKNAIAMNVLPLISIIFIHSYLAYKKLAIIPLIIIIIGIGSIFMSGSGTGLVISLLLIFFVIFHKKNLPNFKIYMGIYFFLFLAIVILRLQELLFGNFILNILDKDLSFTGRTQVWDMILNIISDSWILGFGRGNNIVNSYFYNLTETHNGILEILMYSGLVGLILFIVLIIMAGKKLDLFYRYDISKVLSFSVFSYMIIGLTESVFLRKEFWLLLVLAYGISNIIKAFENQENRIHKNSMEKGIVTNVLYSQKNSILLVPNNTDGSILSLASQEKNNSTEL